MAEPDDEPQARPPTDPPPGWVPPDRASPGPPWAAPPPGQGHPGYNGAPAAGGEPWGAGGNEPPGWWSPPPGAPQGDPPGYGQARPAPPWQPGAPPPPSWPQQGAPPPPPWQPGGAPPPPWQQGGQQPGGAPPPWQQGGGPPAWPAPAPTRAPLPEPTMPRRMLQRELALVLLLAFAPGALGLVVTLLGGAASNSPETQIGPAAAAAVFDLFLSWAPVLVLAYLLTRNREGWATIGLGRLGTPDLGMGIGLGAASWVLVFVLALLFSRFGTRQVDFLPSGLPLWFRSIEAVAIATTAGVTEEVIVRGYAQTRLEQLRAPVAVIILLPTLLWGSLHLYEGVGAAMTVFCLGLMYALYFYRTRRLWPLVIAHGLFDLTQLVLLLATHH